MRLTDIGFRVPPALEPVREQVLAIVEQLEEFQVSAAKELGIDEEGVPFHVKKEVTSALRRLAPIGLSTDILWTANARTLRHVIEMRTADGAEEELRLVFYEIARIDARRGAWAVPGLRPPGRRVLGPGVPQGLKRRGCWRRRILPLVVRRTRSAIVAASLLGRSASGSASFDECCLSSIPRVSSLLVPRDSVGTAFRSRYALPNGSCETSEHRTGVKVPNCGGRC